jgi:alpha-tubulin suppressor-like RCC1 family protein
MSACRFHVNPPITSVIGMFVRRVLPVTFATACAALLSQQAHAAVKSISDKDLLQVKLAPLDRKMALLWGAVCKSLRPTPLQSSQASAFALPDGFDVKELSFGSRYAAAVDAPGSLFVLLPASQRGATSNAIELPGVRASQISCSESSLYAITSGGYLYQITVPADMTSSTSAKDFVVTQIADFGRFQTPVKVVAGRDHVVVLTASGDVFTRGLNQYGQLGQISQSEELVAPAASEKFERVFVSTVKTQTAQLLRSAQSRQAQRTAEFNAGIVKSTASTPAVVAPAAAPQPEFGLVAPVTGVSIVDRALGAAVAFNNAALQRERAALELVNHALKDTMRTPSAELALSAEEEVAEPLPPSSIDPVIDIAAGANHTVLVTKSGRVYTCGEDTLMQCAQGRPWVTGLQSRAFPTLVQPLKEVKAIAAVAGEAHTAIIARIDEAQPRTAVITWGCGDRGQLGHEATNVHVSPPRVVDSLHGLKQFSESDNSVMPLNVVQLAAGSVRKFIYSHLVHQFGDLIFDFALQNHMLALLQDGTVMTWGVGHAGQCGHGTRATVRVPRMLRAADGVGAAAAPTNEGASETRQPIKARRVFAGADSSAIVL